MKRTVNSTGRKKLSLDHVLIRLADQQGPGVPRTFSAELPGIADTGLPGSARVYIEPYARSSFMRFDFGTVAAPRQPADTRLMDIDDGASVLFDVKVVDEAETVGRILASARHVRPLDSTSGDDNRKSLLPIVVRDMGELVWSLDREPGARPTLVLNSRIPNVGVRLKTDPLLQGAILPAAIAQIIDVILDPEGDSTDELEWVSDWKTWLETATGSDGEEETDAEQRRIAVRKACESFALQQRFASRTTPLDDAPEAALND